jgi:hypothetical protein
VAVAKYVSIHQKYVSLTAPETFSSSLKDRHLFDVVTEKKKSPIMTTITQLTRVRCGLDGQVAR